VLGDCCTSVQKPIQKRLRGQKDRSKRNSNRCAVRSGIDRNVPPSPKEQAADQDKRHEIKRTDERPTNEPNRLIIESKHPAIELLAESRPLPKGQPCVQHEKIEKHAQARWERRGPEKSSPRERLGQSGEELTPFDGRSLAMKRSQEVGSEDEYSYQCSDQEFFSFQFSFHIACEVEVQSSPNELSQPGKNMNEPKLQGQSEGDGRLAPATC